MTQLLNYVWVISVESHRLPCTKMQSKDVEIDALKIYVALQFVSQAVLESYDGTNVGKLDQVKVGCCAQTG